MVTKVSGPVAAAPPTSQASASSAALARLLVLEEEERGALAGLLHDGPVQDLVATRYLADLAGLALRRRDGGTNIDLAGFEDRISALRAGAQDALAGTRRMLGSLTARCLDGTGLPGALAAAAAGAGESGLAVTLVAADPALEVLPPGTAVLAWRMVQAVLTDCAARGAAKADVAARCEGGELLLTLSTRCSPNLDSPAVAPWTARVGIFGGSTATGPTGLTVRLPAATPVADGRHPHATPDRAFLPADTEEAP